MKRSRRVTLPVLCCVLGLAAWHQSERPQAVAQGFPGMPSPSTNPREQVDDGIPPAAYLTDRGRELAENLRSLRRTRANLGAKHPTLPVIEQAIAETQQQLRAWLPEDPIAENPFKNRDTTPPATQAGPPAKAASVTMNDADLRQLVLRLYKKIESLEARVRTLEQARR